MEEVRQIVALPVVRKLLQLEPSEKTKGGFQAFLWCHAGHAEHGGCGKEREPAVQPQLTKGRLAPDAARMPARAALTPQHAPHRLSRSGRCWEGCRRRRRE